MHLCDSSGHQQHPGAPCQPSHTRSTCAACNKSVGNLPLVSQLFTLSLGRLFLHYGVHTTLCRHICAAVSVRARWGTGHRWPFCFSKGDRRTLGHKEGKGLCVSGNTLAGIQRCLNPRTVFHLQPSCLLPWSAPPGTPPSLASHHRLQRAAVAWGLAPGEDGLFRLSATCCLGLLSPCGARGPPLGLA